MLAACSRWLLLAPLAAVLGCKREAAESATPTPAVAVTVAEVLVRDQPIYTEYVGQTRGSQEVQVRARVEGLLESIHFQEGGMIEQGQLLYVIDPKPYRAAVAEAAGQLARAEAAWANARQDLIRFEPLIQRNAISRQQYDEAVTMEKASAAAVESARAALEAAELQLGYTRVHAPVSGLIGKSEVQPGNVVGRGELTLLTSISTIDPIHVRFSVSERVYLEYARQRRERESRQGPQERPFQLFLSDGSRYPHRGALVFADRNVDSATGTLLVEAAFPNPDHILRPGQFARVRFTRAILTNAVLVPQRAVLELQATYTAFVVSSNVARRRSIRVGPRVDGLSVIESGLSPGDLVVLEGAQRLQDGTPVNPTRTEIRPAAAVPEPEGAPPGAPPPAAAEPAKPGASEEPPESASSDGPP